jgi:two-component system, LytTR family, response regulator
MNPPHRGLLARHSSPRIPALTMSPLRVLLVDDERLARQELRSLLDAHANVDIVGEAETVDRAAALVRTTSPDAVFLDVQMPPDSGFALLDRVDRPFKLVFVTAYDAYAIRAFEVNALDYLLKPVHPDRLARALERLMGDTSPPPSSRPLEYSDRLFVEVHGRVRFVALESIVAVRAADDYTEIIVCDGEILLVTRSMREWEARLPERQFARIHRSMIVNLNHVEHVESASDRGYRVRLRGVREPVAMSRRHAARLRSLFS